MVARDCSNEPNPQVAGAVQAGVQMVGCSVLCRTDVAQGPAGPETWVPLSKVLHVINYQGSLWLCMGHHVGHLNVTDTRFWDFEMAGTDTSVSSATSSVEMGMRFFPATDFPFWTMPQYQCEVALVSPGTGFDIDEAFRSLAALVSCCDCVTALQQTG